MNSTAEAWLRRATERLTEAGIATARLDCLVLLEDATGKDRGWLLAHPDFELPAAFATILDAKVYRRVQHIPLAYIRGQSEFYGRKFAVNAHTLVPRPETETMIDLLKTLLPQGPSLTQEERDTRIIDVGTGSGAIAITVKLELPKTAVIATDIDEKCLETARQNTQKLEADIEFLHGSLLEPLRGSSLMTSNSILLANLPYVPDDFKVNAAATHEPHQAIFGGTDGLDIYRELFDQLKNSSPDNRPWFVLAESLPEQHQALAIIAKPAGYTLQTTDDFIQLFERV